MKDRRISYRIAFQDPVRGYGSGYEGTVQYDTYLKIWTASVNCQDHWEQIRPETADGDAIYFSAPAEGVKWVEGVMESLILGKDRTKLPGFQGLNEDSRAKAAAKAAEIQE